VDPVFGGEVVEREQLVEIVGDLRNGLEPVGELITVRAGARKRIMAVGGVSRRR